MVLFELNFVRERLDKEVDELRKKEYKAMVFAYEKCLEILNKKD